MKLYIFFGESALFRAAVAMGRHPLQQTYAPPILLERRSKSRDVYAMVPDAELAQRLADGDKESERLFVDRYSALLGIKLRARLRSPQEIEDVRQEVFLRVVKQLHQKGGLDKPESFGAFVHSVCNRVLLELFRARRRHPAPAGEESARPEVADGGSAARRAVDQRRA